MPVTLKTTLVGLLALLAIAGCAGDPVISRGGLTTVEDHKTYFDTRLTAGECLFEHPDPGGEEAGFIGTLAASVLPGLIDKGVSSLAKLLKEAGKAHQYDVAIERPLQFRQGEGGIPKCFQITRGHFLVTPPPTKPTGAWVPDPVAWDRLLQAGLTLAGEPDFFAELPFYLSNDGTAVAAAVRAVTYNRPLGSKKLRKNDEKRGLAINMAFLMDEEQDLDKVPVISLDLGTQDAGFQIKYETPQELYKQAKVPGQNQGIDTPQQSGQTGAGSTDLTTTSAGVGSGTGFVTDGTSSDEPEEATEESSSDDQTVKAEKADKANKNFSLTSTNRFLPITSRWIPIALTGSSKPVTVWVQLVETQDPNKLLKFLGETLEESDAADELKKAIVPGEKEKAEAAEAIENREAVKNYFTAWATAQPKVDAYNNTAFKDGKPVKSDEAAQAAIEALAAQEDANVAALIADRTPPYTTLIDPAEHQ